MPHRRITDDPELTRLRWPLWLTWFGLFAERLVQAFWPLAAVVLAALAAVMFGFHELVAIEAVWAGLVLAGLGAAAALIFGVLRFRRPRMADAWDRLDRTVAGQPIAALRDHQAIGAGDGASEQVWQEHRRRMAERAASAHAPAPDLRVASRDPYALRFVALLAFVMALIFGSGLRVATMSDLVSGGAPAVAAGPSWEGWIEPPAYTGKPTIYLADVDGELNVPQGSRVTLRLYGEVGALTVNETVSGRTQGIESAAAPDQSFDIAQSGVLEIVGRDGASWTVNVVPDQPPEVSALGPPERGVSGELRQEYEAQDDFGVIAGRAEIELDLDAIDRRLGLAVQPEPRETIVLDLPMPISGDRREFAETLIENLSQHPWATLPVRITLFAEDAARQEGVSEPQSVILPGRRFFDPLAGAIAEQRRDLLWSRLNAERVALILRSVSHRPDEVFRSNTAYLMLRVAIRRLESGLGNQPITTELQEETAQALWEIALLIEDGNLSDALERLRRAQDRLEQAMRDGATDEEIAELMDELREAMQDYMQQLAEQAQENNEFADNQNSQEITGQQLQDMLDRLQELMEQGRTAEAQQLLDQLRQMMENMQMAQNQQGQGQQNPGQQALEGLADTLRQQQGLNDDTFGDLQQQFGEQGLQGQQERQGPQGQPGQQGQQGQQGQDGQQGQGQRPGQGDGSGQGEDPGQGLADRQQALRQLLDQQAGRLPGSGTPGGDAARDALDRAGRAMDDAEDALRQDDLAGALDDQAEAIDAMREGMRELAEQMQQQQQQGQQGEAFGQTDSNRSRDPLGREAGNNGQIGTDEELLQGEDVYRRARELLEEIRRRSADPDRPDVELDYLKRLLDRF